MILKSKEIEKFYLGQPTNNKSRDRLGSILIHAEVFYFIFFFQLVYSVSDDLDLTALH